MNAICNGTGVKRSSKYWQSQNTSLLNEIYEPTDCETSKEAPQGLTVSSRTQIGKDQRLSRSDKPKYKLDRRSTVRPMIGNIKETFLPKTDMQKRQVLQDPGYVRGAKGACCILHGTLQGNIQC